jgi:hypothetical protein
LAEVDSAMDWFASCNCRKFEFDAVDPSYRITHKSFVHDLDFIVGLPYSLMNIEIVQGETCVSELALGENHEVEAASQCVNMR